MGFLTKRGRRAFGALQLERARADALTERMRWTLKRACEDLTFHVPEGYDVDELSRVSPRRVSTLAQLETGLAATFERLATGEVDEDGFRRILRRWYDLQRQCFGAYEVMLPRAA